MVFIRVIATKKNYSTSVILGCCCYVLRLVVDYCCFIRLHCNLFNVLFCICLFIRSPHVFVV